MILIDGKKEAASLRLKLKDEVIELKKKFNNVPGLTVILIGELAPSQIYVRNKEKSANEVGLNSHVIRYPNDVDEKTTELLNQNKIENKKKNISFNVDPSLRNKIKKAVENTGIIVK